MRKELVKHWMTRDVVTISPDTPLPEAHRLMSEKQIRRLPIVDHNRVVGIITLGDVREAEPSDATSLSIWEMNYLLAKQKVDSLMTKNPLTISPEATISEAARLMLEQKVSGLPVIDQNEKLVGIITESDVFRLIVQAWDKMEEAVS
ncbi:MAG: CBS domain-containing protein [Anaerolineae bacterium]|nr:CBS domain-containing protein [Anaerolineae bacterium]